MSETAHEQPKRTAESILAQYKVEDVPVEVLLSDGGVMTFRPLPTTRSRKALEASVDNLIEGIPGFDDKGHSTHFLRGLPELSTSDLRFSAEIHLRGIDPPISFETACAWHQAPALVQRIETPSGAVARRSPTPSHPPARAGAD